MDDEFMNALVKKSGVNLTYKPPVKKQFFHLKKTTRYEFLKERLCRNKEYFQDILSQEFKPVNYLSEKSFLTYGSILVDESGVIYIYNNTDESNDTMIRLNFDYYKRYSLFNGQIVVVRGKNVGNNEIIVQCIHCIPTINIPDEKSSLKCHIKIIQTLNSLKFKQNELSSYNADVVIFVGCDVPSFVSDLKNTKFKQTHFLHVPTMEDLDCVEVYPMNYKQIDKKLVVGLNNPCEFKINNKDFCINTLPVLDLLSSIEICRNEEVPSNDICGNKLFSQDVIGRLCYHLIFQRSYLPTFNINHVSYDINTLSMDVAPQYYIIRSNKFDPFCRDIGPTKIINIGLKYNWDIKINGKETKLSLIE